MSAHLGPACGHQILGTCPGCGGRTFPENLTNATCTYGPVTVTAEALAEAQRRVGELQRLCEENERRMLELMMKPMVFVKPVEDPDPIEMRMRSYMNIGPTIRGTFYVPPDPVDPLDVKYDGATLRTLLEYDEGRRRETHPNHVAAAARRTPAQRAAVSAYWSAQLRAKVAASAAADKAREPSIVVDIED